MSFQQKYSGVAKGFLLGSLLVFSIMYFGSNRGENESPAANVVSFDEAVARIKSDDIREIKIKDGTAEFLKDEQLAYATGVSERQLSLLLRQMDSSVEKVSFAPAADSKHPLVYLIQILFWLFFISPPIIVVLLLIIIKKLDARKG
ncbi:MAG: hypothetical protein M3384_15795 [Acidobacteriota bacterium]|nr:hypothetical protein [Acidobacteriota bacterium]